MNCANFGIFVIPVLFAKIAKNYLTISIFVSFGQLYWQSTIGTFKYDFFVPV